MTNLKNKAIIFIHKDKFEYYDELQSKIFQFIFQPTVFQDLELVDPDELNKQLKTFIQTNKLSPANILFVISDLIIFEKVFTVSLGMNKDLEIQKFLESIPFEHVIYKVYNSEKNFKVLAINKEIYTSLQMAFEAMGFASMGIIAQFSLGDSYKNINALNGEIIKYVILHFDALHSQTFIQEEVKEASEENTGQQNFTDPVNLARPVNKYRLPALISVFVLLMGILGFVIYKQYTPPTNANPVPPPIVVPTAVIQPPSVSETPISSSSAEPLK